jgi:hypothetical protein
VTSQELSHFPRVQNSQSIHLELLPPLLIKVLPDRGKKNLLPESPVQEGFIQLFLVFQTLDSNAY